MPFHIFHISAETVIYRIFYYINRSGNGRLTLRELKRGNIIDAMLHADEEEDINKVLRYLSCVDISSHLTTHGPFLFSYFHLIKYSYILFAGTSLMSIFMLYTASFGSWIQIMIS